MKNHMTNNHGEFVTSVDKISEVYSETNTGLTVVSQDDIIDNNDCYKKTKPDCEPSPDYENYEVHKQLKEIEEIDNVLTSIDRLVNDGLTNPSDEKDEIDKKQLIISERLSPLEQFNTLYRHVSGARASIKLKESDMAKIKAGI